MDGGPFQVACRRLLAKGFRLDWQSHARLAGGDGIEGEEGGEEPKPKGRIKYTCPQCELNAWAKPEATILCGECSTAGEEGELVTMQPAEAA